MACWFPGGRYRTNEPEPLADLVGLDLTGNWDDVAEHVPEEAKAIWENLLAYELGLPLPRVDLTAAELAAAEAGLFSLEDPIPSEPKRVGAGYVLAKAGAAGVAALEKGLCDGSREEVRRCAAWGLCAMPTELATPALLRSLSSDVKSVRKHAAFSLGEAGAPTAEVVEALTGLLATDTSTWVRTAAAGALGAVGVRAAAVASEGWEGVVGGCCSVLVACLGREVNRSQAGSPLNNPEVRSSSV